MFSFTNTAFAAEKGIEVHLAPFVLTHIGSIPITSSLLATWLVVIILFVLAFFVTKKLKEVPGKIQSIFELLIGEAYSYIEGVLEDKQVAKRYFPIIITIFIFVLFMNWIEFIPGIESIGFFSRLDGENSFIPLLTGPSKDLNNTIAIAIIAFITVEVAGVTIIGLFKYVTKFVNFSSPLAFVIGLIELISELARLIAFSFRLFGNIFAGSVLLLVIMFLTSPYLVPIPFMAYEVFVGFIQAFIFSILTLFFIKVAITEAEH